MGYTDHVKKDPVSKGYGGNTNNIHELARGVNSDRPCWKGCTYSRHAEMDALLGLKPNRSKRKKVVDIVVIRVGPTGALKSSKPCQKCLKHMAKLKGYRVRYIYYSESDGSITRKTFTELYHSSSHTSTRFRASSRNRPK